MKKIEVSFIAILLTIFPKLFNSVYSQEVLSFPGADGFGKFTSGGRGGIVIFVTNLNDTGPGSLRNAINNAAARTIIFKISGTINLKSDLRIKNGNLTIAGQTAPGFGICIKGYSTIVDADNVIIRYIRFRPGDELSLTGVTTFENDALTGRNHDRIIIDHCSMSWAIDEISSFYDNSDFTMQWCIISESFYNSYHVKGAHGYGGIWGGMKASFLHNLLANNTSRNPRFCGARYHIATASQEIVDFRNNVIFNWGGNSIYGGEGGHYNIVNNYFKPGPATKGSVLGRIVNPSYSADPKVDSLSYWYLSGNVIDGNPSVTNDNWLGFQPDANALWKKAESQFPYVIDSTYSALEAFNQATKYCGASLPKHDTVDKRILSEVISGDPAFGGVYGRSAGIIDSQKDVGGYPNLLSANYPADDDNDGMPNDWELEQGLNPNNDTDRNNILNSDGYTALEVYINGIKEYEGSIEPPVNTINKTTEAKFSEINIYPNPIVDQATISFNLVNDCNVSLFLCDTEGRQINKIIDNQQFTKGLKQIKFHLQNNAGIKNGVYLISAKLGNNTYFNRIMIKN